MFDGTGHYQAMVKRIGGLDLGARDVDSHRAGVDLAIGGADLGVTGVFRYNRCRFRCNL